MITLKYKKETKDLKIETDTLKVELFFKIGEYIGVYDLKYSELFANSITILNFDINEISNFIKHINITEVTLKII